MTKILMTSVRPDEQKAINDFAEKHHIDVVTTSKPFIDDEAIAMTKGMDGFPTTRQSS